MLSDINFDAYLSIVCDSKNQNFSNKNIKILGYITDQQSLINVYDEHNIMVLPSYTEATPYVVDEALSRKRPVIIFEDINYIVRGRIGIFVSKRNINSFSETTKYILDNYQEIQKKMEKNVLPTKDDMIKQISDIINPAILAHYEKASLRSLTKSEVEQLEHLKLCILCGMQPFIEVTPEIVSDLLSRPISVDASTSKLLAGLKEDFLNKNGRQPNIDEVRRINVSCYALSKTG